MRRLLSNFVSSSADFRGSLRFSSLSDFLTKNKVNFGSEFTFMKCFDPKGGDLCSDDEFKRIFKNEEVEFMFDADEKKKSRGNTRIGLSYKV